MNPDDDIDLHESPANGDNDIALSGYFATQFLREIIAVFIGMPATREVSANLLAKWRDRYPLSNLAFVANSIPFQAVSYLTARIGKLVCERRCPDIFQNVGENGQSLV